jgi:CHASE2 domain-containing sensor protein/signal transduction histidine kinase
VISLLSSILAYTEKTEGLDWLLYDKAMNLSFLPPADDIVIIDIDNKSISQLGRWPWPRKVHAELLDKLTQAQSKIVVFDVLFPELETGNYQSDLLFAQAIKHHGSVILPIYLETLGQQGQVVENPPHSLFYTQVLALGHAHLHAEADGVIRSVFLKEGVGRPYWPHLSLSLFNNLNNTEISAWTVPGSRAEEPLNTTSTVGIVRDFHNLIPMPSPIQGLRHYSYSDILNGAIDLKNLHEKIIFVGSTASGLGDVLATPVGSMNGVELNAWVFQGLRSDKLIQTLPALNLAILSFVCVLLLVLVLGRLSPRLFLVFSSVAIAVILCVVIMFLLYMNIWLPPISAVVGIVVFFPLWSWLRAESILRFLRQEIEVLSQTTFHQESTPNRQQTAQYFLEQTGILDPVSKQKTQIGELAITALCSEHTQNLDSNFWHKQVQQHSDKESYLPKEYKGIEVIARTISQLSTIKESDRKNRQLIEKSLSSLQDAVCIADLCGEITFTNKRFEQWFQTHQTSLGLLGILKNLELKSGTSWPQALSNLYKTNKLFIEEAILKGTNNQQFLCQASLVSINEAYSDTLILTFTDITELKAAENARAEALSFLSHDLRSPMVSVLAILDRYSSANSSKLSNEAIQDIESLVRKNLDYAESFLQLSKADAFVETNMRPCDLHAVLDAAQVQAMALARPKSIKVVTERCDDDVWVLGDINLLERALNNLISNAVKFSPEGSLLRLSLTKFDQDALLSVEDQGVGIDKCDQASIFDRFIRLKASADTDGAGLGLNFVATVAKKHLGKVSLKSALNLGSTFTMHLPALKEQELFDHFEEKYYH